MAKVVGSWVRMPMGLDERMAVLGPHVFNGVPLTKAAEQAGVPLRTARRWLASYLENGSAGLSRDGRSDRGGHRMPIELLELVEGLALRRPPPRVAEVCRAATVAAAEHGWPHLAQVCADVKVLPTDRASWLRCGARRCRPTRPHRRQRDPRARGCASIITTPSAARAIRSITTGDRCGSRTRQQRS
jgi:transposase